MEHGPFYRLQREKVIEGQRLLAGTSRALLLRTEPDIHDVLSDAGDAAFLEPLLFAWFNASKAGRPVLELPQVILGYVDRALWPEAIEVYADSRGCISLPRIGYFLTGVRERKLLLRWEEAAGRFTLEEEGGAPVDFRFEEPLLVPGTPIELCRYPNPLYELLLSDPSGRGRAVELKEDVRPYLEPLARAFAVIREQRPDFYADVLATVRQLVVFHSGELNSCATLGAHGAAFLNVKEGDDEVFFIDDLAHQCGHVLFNAFTARRKDWLALDPDTPLERVSGQKGEHRSVYTILHGAYTEFAMLDCLSRCDEQRVFSGRQGYELRGRLASIFQKSLVDLRNLGHPGLFTPEGQHLYDTFRRFSDEVARQRPELLRYDLSNQPYNFSYERFLALNPPAEERFSGAA